MSRAPRIWPLVVVVAAIALLWLWRDAAPVLRPHDPPPDASGSGVGSGVGSGADIAPSPTITSAEQREPAIAAPAGPTAGEAEAARPVLRVRLRGLVPQAPWTAPLRIDLEGRDDARDQQVEHEDRVAVLADGAARFTLPTWVADATRQKGRIEAQDPNYRELLHRFEGPLDTSVELVLDVQAVAVLEGRVVDGRGKPVSAARVTAFALEDGVAVEPQIGTTSTSIKGTYHIEVAPGTPLLLVATPMQPMQLSGRTLTGRHGAIADLGLVRADLLPAACEARGVLGATSNIPDLVVPDAAQILGIVRWQDGAPIERVHIGMANGAGVPISDNVGVRRNADGSLALSASTFTDEDGTFELPASPGQRVELMVLAIPDTLQFADVTATAVAPARVEVAVPAPIRLRPTLAGEPVEGASIEHRSGSKRCGKDGELAVVAGSPTRVRARHGRFRSAWHELLPQQGGTVVELPLSDALTEVSIEFRGDFPVRNAAFRWHGDDGAEGREVQGRDDRGEPFRLFLAPGHYRLSVGPGPGERNGLYLLPIEREIDVGTTDLRLELPAVFGGRFTVHATDGSGRYVGGVCRVRDATGKDCSDRFLVTSGGSGRGNIGEPAELLAEGPNQFSAILAPGDYELEFGFAEHGSERRRLTIRPREVTDVHVRLP